MEYKINAHNYTFIGNLSSTDMGEELKYFKDHLSNHLENQGGIIFIYTDKEGEKGKGFLEKHWDLDIDYLSDLGRILFLSRDKFSKSKDPANFIKAIEEGLDFLSENGAKSKVVYLAVDGFWDFFGEEGLRYIYNKLRTMAASGRSIFLLRYLVRELTQKQFDFLLEKHEYLLVDGRDGFYIYTPGELISESLVLKSEYNSLSKNYKKEMERVEHLRVLGELMENTIHDINNLLGTISGYAQLSLGKGIPPEHKEYLELINKAALDGGNIIDRIRSHARGSYDKEKDFYKIDEILKDPISMTRHKFQKGSTINEKELRLETDLNSNSYIFVNEYDIRQSMLNIILNGVDAMDSGGVLSIKSFERDNKVVVRIEDSGKGIDEEIINEIFDNHFTTKGAKGTGLGLNIVKKTIENYGGQVAVDSKLGEGTRLTFNLPILEYEKLDI